MWIGNINNIIELIENRECPQRITHDRSMLLDNGWKVVLGRRLDIFQKTGRWYDFAEYYQEKRLCKVSEITYVQIKK